MTSPCAIEEGRVVGEDLRFRVGETWYAGRLSGGVIEGRGRDRRSAGELAGPTHHDAVILRRPAQLWRRRASVRH